MSSSSVPRQPPSAIFSCRIGARSSFRPCGGMGPKPTNNQVPSSRNSLPKYFSVFGRPVANLAFKVVPQRFAIFPACSVSALPLRSHRFLCRRCAGLGPTHRHRAVKGPSLRASSVARAQGAQQYTVALCAAWGLAVRATFETGTGARLRWASGSAGYGRCIGI